MLGTPGQLLGVKTREASDGDSQRRDALRVVDSLVWFARVLASCILPTSTILLEGVAQLPDRAC